MIARSQVSLNGNIAHAWKYRTRASTLGRSYALNSCRGALVVPVDGVDMFGGNGINAMRHIFAQFGSRHPVMRGCCCGLQTTTYCFVKTTLQSASHMLPIPINVCLNNVIMCPVRGKSAGRWGKTNVPVPMEFCT